jgi:predicted nucleotidyltransferase
VLAGRWIEAGLGAVPMQFATLLDAVAPQGPVLEAIYALMDAKKAGFESDRGARIQVLNDFLSAEIARLRCLHLRAPKRPHAEEMDRFFRSALQRA